MSGVRDAVGNELQIGDLVEITLDSSIAIGRVTALDQGGLIAPMGKDGMEMMGKMVVTFETTAMFKRGAAIIQVRSLKDPDPKKAEAIRQIAKAQSGTGNA